MEARLVVLNRLLETLGVTPDVSSIDARKRMQKAVYLAQASGLKLGYAYGWYLLGPYSTSLARDYYSLSAALGSGDTAVGDLRDDVRAGLEPVRAALIVPDGVAVSEAAWSELLSSVHFLRRVRNLDEAATAGVLLREKPDLAPHAPMANTALAAANLL